MTNEQIQHMVRRFLGWKLPENFNPDGGISFQRLLADDFSYYPMPVGTNLFDHGQAEAMVRSMVEGLPHPEPLGEGGGL